MMHLVKIDVLGCDYKWDVVECQNWEDVLPLLQFKYVTAFQDCWFVLSEPACEVCGKHKFSRCVETGCRCRKLPKIGPDLFSGRYLF
jgi:hypothetical protein